MKVLFLDESGDHNLSSVDPQYPVFVLGGIIVDQDYADGELLERVDAFKNAWFGRTDIILHTADITRQRRGFESLRDLPTRQRFHAALNALMRDLKYTALVCAVRKDEHFSRYGANALDPYALSLRVLVERFYFEIDRSDHQGVIVAESRDQILDYNLKQEWESLKVKGTEYLAASQLTARITDLSLQHKRANLVGLQIADLIVTPAGRHVLEKPAREDWEIIQGKLRRGKGGQVLGYGLVVLPKQ